MDLESASRNEEGKRISVLETLQRQSSETAERFERAIDKLQESLDSISIRLSNVGKPQWNVLASWAGVVILFIGLVGGSTIRNVISNQTRIEKAMLKHHDDYSRYTYDTAFMDGKQTPKRYLHLSVY